MRNRRNQQLEIKVFKGFTHIETILRQIYTDKNGVKWCQYRGVRGVVTMITRIDDQGGTKTEYQIHA